MWNGAVGEFSSCVINNIQVDYVLFIFGILLEQIYTLTFYIFFVCFMEDILLIYACTKNGVIYNYMKKMCIL